MAKAKKTKTHPKRAAARPARKPSAKQLAARKEKVVRARESMAAFIPPYETFAFSYPILHPHDGMRKAKHSALAMQKKLLRRLPREKRYSAAARAIRESVKRIDGRVEDVLKNHGFDKTNYNALRKEFATLRKLSRKLK